MTSTVRVVVGLALVALGIFLASSPVMVADWLGKPTDTGPRLINLRASYGGTLTGVGAFVAWLPAPRPFGRAFVGLLMWAMAGIAAARLLGFVLDGAPDTRQFVWITAEVVITAVCAAVLRTKFRPPLEMKPRA